MEFLYSLVVLLSRSNIIVYTSIVADHIFPMLESLFSNCNAIFQNNNARIHSTNLVQNWSKEHKNKVDFMDWCLHLQKLRTTEHAWCINEQQIIGSHPPLLKERKKALTCMMVKITSIPAQKLYESGVECIKAVIDIKC